MTHLYTLITGARIDAGPGRHAGTALVIAEDTVLLVGTDAEAAAVSRGDSMAIDLGGADVVGELEVGSPADFEVWSRRGTPDDRPVLVARVRAGRLVEGDLPGWHDHEPGAAHDSP